MPLKCACSVAVLIISRICAAVVLTYSNSWLTTKSWRTFPNILDANIQTAFDKTCSNEFRCPCCRFRPYQVVQCVYRCIWLSIRCFYCTRRPSSCLFFPQAFKVTAKLHSDGERNIVQMSFKVYLLVQTFMSSRTTTTTFDTLQRHKVLHWHIKVKEFSLTLHYIEGLHISFITLHHLRSWRGRLSKSPQLFLTRRKTHTSRHRHTQVFMMTKYRRWLSATSTFQTYPYPEWIMCTYRNCSSRTRNWLLSTINTPTTTSN